MMTYEETLAYLYESAPLFQQIGGGAYKAGLETTQTLDAHFGHPHRKFRTIHIAGTNGKGTCSHSIAAVLQTAGYRVGLYTSPHLTDFRERIRINGEMMPKNYVVDFVANERAFFEPLHPSFFELTTAMAFKYFADQHVDVAVVEVGLGGRIDCTNIITPELSVITNISLDHTQFLGTTLSEIAGEKAGIIKTGIPAVVGETTPETRPVFMNKARELHAPITYAEDEAEVMSVTLCDDFTIRFETRSYGTILSHLTGVYQQKNMNTLLTAIRTLSQTRAFNFTTDHVRTGLADVAALTGLRGRWQMLQTSPTVVCDTGHNVGAWTYLAEQLRHVHCQELRIVFGMAADKDIDAVLSLLPTNAVYYFTKASVRRAMNEDDLRHKAVAHGLNGRVFSDVATAYRKALAEASADDFIFVGGSSFIVADLFSLLEDHPHD